ncbi:hypothetical protein V1521DRAFT_419475, partial [Lipomyces starkeyi]
TPYEESLLLRIRHNLDYQVVITLDTIVDSSNQSTAIQQPLQLSSSRTYFHCALPISISRFYQVMSPGDMATTNQVLFSKSGYYGDFPKLKGEDNYLSWKQSMLLHLRAFQLAEALEYTMDISELPEEKLKKNSNALSCLLINMESTYQKIHITAIKARDVWRALEEQFALIWAASKPRLMCNLYSTKMKDDMTLEAHFNNYPISGINLLLPRCTSLASHHTEYAALTEGSTDSAYSVKLNRKGSTKSICFQGRKKKHDSKKHLKCTHCGMRFHEAKDCRVKKYQLQQVQNARQQANIVTVKDSSEITQKATAFSCELDPEFVAAMCRLSSHSKMTDSIESVMAKQSATLGNIPTKTRLSNVNDSDEELLWSDKELDDVNVTSAHNNECLLLPTLLFLYLIKSVSGSWTLERANTCAMTLLVFARLKNGLHKSISVVKILTAKSTDLVMSYSVCVHKIMIRQLIFCYGTFSISRHYERILSAVIHLEKMGLMLLSEKIISIYLRS